MATKTLLKDTLDYIFIDSGSPDSYLISNEVDSIFRNGTGNGRTIGFGTSNILLNDTETNDTILLLNNATGILDNNGTDSTSDDITELIKMAATSIVLGLMILITIIGNVFVIAAIILERNLQNVANYLVASLAVADLFVACLVMPLGAVYEISQGWILGPELCDIWTSCDVLCCTASILHLVAIAMDRYWAVTNVDYMHSRTSRRIFLMIFLVWFAAVIVSLAPQFGWKDPEYLKRIEEQKCMVSQDVGYQVFATCCTFYVPLLVILVLYWKIYQTARKRIHRRRPRPIDVAANNNQPAIAQKKKKRLKLRIGKFADRGKSAASSLGLVEGNSTNTVNTVEDTEFSSSNVDNKSRAGIEVTTTFNNPDEIATSSTSQISTVSHLVSIANQTASNEQNPNIIHQNQTSTQQPTSILVTHKQQQQKPEPGPEPEQQSQEQQQLPPEEQQQQQSVNISTHGITTSTATTTTSISALSPQTPVNQITSGIGGGSMLLAATAITATTTPSSNQVTPIQQNKQIHQAQQQQPQQQQQLSSIPNPQSKVTKRKETLEAKRERKAAKTLAIITGAFVVCWLPFFLTALWMPLCGDDCYINDGIASFFLWLGYFNSTLNPVIYTIFSPEFRQAFKRILFGGHRPRHYRH